jgi:hypothetical protein
MGKTSKKLPRTPVQRALFVVRGFVVGVVGVVLLLPTLIGFSFIGALTFGGSCGDLGYPPVVPHEDVRFLGVESGSDFIPAYFIPGRANAQNGAAILALPTNLPRGDRPFQWMPYHEAGYHVLTFSGRGCLTGVNALGGLEALQVGDALAYLRTRPDVDMTRVGAHGFSQAGAAAIMAAARYPELRAVIAEGGYDDFGGELARGAERLGLLAPLFDFGGRLAYRLRVGQDVSVLSPISVIHTIAPRSILLIYGTNEPSLDGARRQVAAAVANAQLWEVSGAGHGDYAAVAGDEYARRIVAFMDGAFAPR